MGQAWNPETYQRHAGFVAELGRPAVELLAPRPGERVLDLGCGDGRLTEVLVAAGCVVVGVDASAQQVEAARARGLEARVMDGEALEFREEFDAVFSNAALHWMKRPRRVLEGVWRALRPGGRFVGEFGAKDNVATVAGAIEEALRRRRLSYAERDPWYYPTADEYRAELVAAGFDVRHLETFARPTPLPGGMVEWLETFAGAFCREVERALAPALFRDGRWFVDYVRLRFQAVKRQSD